MSFFCYFFVILFQFFVNLMSFFVIFLSFFNNFQNFKFFCLFNFFYKFYNGLKINKRNLQQSHNPSQRIYRVQFQKLQSLHLSPKIKKPPKKIQIHRAPRRLRMDSRTRKILLPNTWIQLKFNSL